MIVENEKKKKKKRVILRQIRARLSMTVVAQIVVKVNVIGLQENMERKKKQKITRVTTMATIWSLEKKGKTKTF